GLMSGSGHETAVAVLSPRVRYEEVNGPGSVAVRGPRLTQSGRCRKRRSVDDEPEIFDHRLPFAFFALDIPRVFHRRAGDRIAADTDQVFPHVFRGHDLAQFP